MDDISNPSQNNTLNNTTDGNSVELVMAFDITKKRI